jgi:hypothetical protein
MPHHRARMTPRGREMVCSRREPSERATVVRYEWPCPGNLLHMDVKKLGKFTEPGHAIRLGAIGDAPGHPKLDHQTYPPHAMSALPPASTIETPPRSKGPLVGVRLGISAGSGALSALVVAVVGPW